MEKFKSFFTKKRIISIVAIVLVIAIAATVVSVVLKNKTKKSEADSEYIEAEAQLGTVTKTIEASGVIEPLDRYEITSLVRGEIISSPFEEGDFVNEDDVLYRIDDEDAQISIEKTNNSIAKTKISQQNTLDDISKLKIYAPVSGMLGDLKLKETAQAASGEVATITNTDDLTIKIPFLASDFDNISLGDRVTLTSAMYMTTLEGKVTYKYSANESTALDGSSIKNIEVTVTNPGALGIGATVSATVHASSRDVQSAASGTVDKGTVTSVISDVNGTVKALYVKEGDYVEKGQLIAVLENDSLMDEKKTNEINMADNELSLRSSIKNLEDYTITSPISGTVITKNSKAGDNIDSTNSQTVMMVIADMSKVKFLISVDELDIASVQLGQTAIVDADAITDKTFNGIVTNIAAEGISTGDGVTTFDVEITIDEPGELKSGMNVNANIVVAEAADVVTIPEEALTGSDGSTAMVLVKSADAGAANSDKNANKEDKEPKGDMPNGDMPKGDMPKGDMPKGGEAKGQENNDRMAKIPDGFELKKVEIGISDGTNVEIKSGLNAGDVITYKPTTANTNDMFSMMRMGAMGGGMGGGPQGGGQRPSGGGNGGGNGGGRQGR